MASTEENQMSAAQGLRPIIRQQRGLIWGALIFGIFINLLMFTGPLFMLLVYDRVMSSYSEATLVALFVLVTFLFVIMGVLDYARGRLIARIGARLQEALDAPLYRISMARARGETRGADPLAPLNCLTAVQQFFLSPALSGLFDLPWMPVFITMIFLFHPLLGWLALLGATILILLSLTNSLLGRHALHSAQREEWLASTIPQENIPQAGFVAAQNMENALMSRWQSARLRALDQRLKGSDITGALTSAIRAARLFLQSAMLGLGAWLALQHQISFGVIIAASIMLGRALAPVEQSIGHWETIHRAWRSWRAITSLMADEAKHETVIPPPHLSLSSPLALPRPKARLSVKAVSLYRPNSRQPLLHGISFDLAPGQALGVIGKSGSGKSTLARLLAGIYPPSLGEITLDTARLSHYSPEDLGRYIGYLPQDAPLFSGSIAQNIARFDPDATDEKIIKAAKNAFAHEIILSLKDGYSTLISQQFSPLSGGQRQRIALARAIYESPELLILDEPNSALDAEGGEALNHLIRARKEAGGSAIIMTHRPLAIAECEQLMILENGKIAALGARDDIIKQMFKNASAIQAHLGAA